MTNTFCSESYLFCVPLKAVTAAVWAAGCPGGAINPIFGFLIGELSPYQKGELTGPSSPIHQ
jgi:hypothetical protein